MNRIASNLVLVGVVGLCGIRTSLATNTKRAITRTPPDLQAELAIETARAHLVAFIKGDGAKLKETYATKIRLTPGHEFLKDEYGLTKPGARARGATVERDKLIAAIVKAHANRPPLSPEQIDGMLKTLTYTPLKTKEGEFVADSTDPVGTPDGKLRFTIKKGDVLLKIAPPRGDFLLMHLRRQDGEWKVVSEYID